MKYYIPPRYFRQEEFVDRATFILYKGKGWDIWRLFRPQILFAIYSLRVRYDKLIRINDWHSGGNFQWRGFRTPDSPQYSVFSQHNGGALDFDVLGMPAEEVRHDILTHQNDIGIEYIAAVEMSVGGKPISWVHIDCRNYDRDVNGILQIKE